MVGDDDERFMVGDDDGHFSLVGADDDDERGESIVGESSFTTSTRVTSDVCSCAV